MVARTMKVGLALLVAGAGLWRTPQLCGQPAAPMALPNGVEVQARGPIHEAFASLTAEAEPSKPIPKRPPKQLDEAPPEEKPEGDVTWIGGYWAWDDERSDFLWVSGTWRAAPPGRTWIAGYWREDGDNWVWVAGFWAAAPKEEAQTQEVTYLPQPPAPPAVAPPPKPAAADSFYVPGSYVWDGEKYVFRAGYWARVEPGYVWVNAHYRWTPTGYIYVGGYWDLAVSRRGILYSPVFIRPEVVTVGFVYTPYYAVRDTIVLDALFVRPCYCHYYYGDYYGPRYRDYGYESCVVYSRGRYDSIIVYETYQRRSDPAWLEVQIRFQDDRYHGRATLPSRTAELVTPAQVAREKGITVVKLDVATRQQAWHQAVNVHQASVTQRTTAEVRLAPGRTPTARVATINVVRAQPVKPGFVAAKAAPVTAPVVRPATAPTAHLDPHSTATHTPPPHPPGPGTAAAPGSHPPGTAVAPGLHPPGTASAPGLHPPGTGTAPPGLHPPGTGTAPPGTKPPLPGTAPGTKPPLPSTTPATKPPPPKPDDKDKDKSKDMRP